MSTADLIRERLATLAPTRLEIRDDSAAHAGHAGARESGGGHFEVMLVSDAFIGRNAVARHRLVYQALADLIPQSVHALSIQAYTPEEAGSGADK